MLHQSGFASTAARFPIDIQRVPGIRRLAVDYASHFGQVADFYAGNPADPGAWSAAIARTRQYARQREAIAELVTRQQHGRGAPAEALAATSTLRLPDSVAVVTGQQAGLFGGPLFTLLKALTALKLAARVGVEHHVPAVAIFWIDAEDHDWDEVKTCGILDGDLNLRHVTLNDPAGAREHSVARMELDDSVAQTVTALESCLPRNEFTSGLIDSLRQIYRPGTGMVGAFARWLETVLGPLGLIVFDASDPGAKPLAASVFAREIDRAGRGVARLAAAAGADLEARGYHAQATIQDASLAIFYLDGGREPIRQQGDQFSWGGRTGTKADLLEQLERTPGAFSPNVLLRPLVQDTLFPTVCYVAGPSELAYLGQLRTVYADFGIPMPLIQLRATLTLLDSNSMRFLDRYQFPLEQLRAQDEAALNQLLEAQLPAEVESSLLAATRAVQERMEEVATAVSQLDSTLEGAARSSLGRMQDDLKKLHGKVIQAAKRKDDTLRRQFRHAQALAFPGGQLQERQVGFVYFLNQYGPGLIDRLHDEITLEMGTHWVIGV